MRFGAQSVRVLYRIGSLATLVTETVKRALNELPDQRKESIVVPIYIRAMKLTVVTTEEYELYQLYTK
jgi:hypothetical protein